MYITCPRCRTSFVVLPEQIGAAGRKVKCSKCNNIWHQKLKEDFKFNEASFIKKPELTTVRAGYVHNYGSGINLPALLPVKIPEYLYILPIFLTSLIIILSLLLFFDVGGLNGEYQNKMLGLSDVHMINDTKLNKTTINYTILNSSANYTLNMPLVRIRLFDQNNKQIKSHLDDHSHILLSPKQYVRIKTSFPLVLDNRSKMDITLGNKLDFMLR